MPENEKLTVDSIKNPKQIYEYLSAGIHGQQEAVKAASMLLYNHIHGRKRNLLFAGPTGCGKTEIWRVLKQIYPHIQIVDSTIITQQGWSGNFKIKDIFAGMEQEEIEKSIIVFDEFDKFCEPKYSSHGNNVGADNQNELLKMIEGNQMTFPDKNGNLTLEFDSSKISFVFCGSFERLMETKTEKESSRSLGFGSNIEKPDVHAQYQKEITPKDLVTYAGIRQEIAGRINQIVQLYPMTAEDYNMILHDQKISPLHQLERQYEVRLYLDEQTSQRLVTEAAESHMGVRYLRSKIQQLLDDQIFQDCEQTEYQLSV